MVRKVLALTFVAAALIGCRKDPVIECDPVDVIVANPIPGQEKMNGISFEGPPMAVGIEAFDPVQQVNANWVSIMPFGIGSGNTPDFNYGTGTWWGETWEGVALTTQMAHDKGMKVMIKPHLWFWNGTWQGHLTFGSEAEWQQFEDNYRTYVLSYAEIADSMQAEAFCIGVELRTFVAERPQFFADLITEVRAVYDGPLTYAANWDDYRVFPHWDQLDMIGVDAYFPLSAEIEPTIEQMKTGYEPHLAILRHFADSTQKQIVFTEFGFRSMDQNCFEPWNTGSGNPVNELNQSRAYEATFQMLWPEEWFGGGFAWKWEADHANAGGPANNDFTPQNKAAESVIAGYYEAWQ